MAITSNIPKQRSIPAPAGKGKAITAPKPASTEIPAQEDSTSVQAGVCKVVDSPAVVNARARAKQRVKDSYRNALNGTFSTGIKGQKVAGCTTDTVEDVTVAVPFNRDCIQAFKAKAVIIAESYGTGSEEGNKVDFSDDEKLILSCGYLPATALIKLKDVPVVIRDADNSYVQVTFADLLRIAHLMECHASDLLDRKWMLEERIDDLGSLPEINALSWESSYNDLDTGGE